MRPYVTAAVDSEIQTLRQASSGRSCATFRAAAAVGNFVGSGEVDRMYAESLLLAAAMETGLSEREAIGHIRRGIRRGEMTPRAIPDTRHYGNFQSSIRQRPTIATLERSAIEEAPARPPRAEVDALWADSRPVGSDRDVCAWFAHRYGSDAASFSERTELWDLARAIPENLHLPGWAWSRGGTWTETGHRILFRLWDRMGQAVSLRARSIDPATIPKSLAPAGYSVRGLVLADPLGAQLLAGTVPEWWEAHDVVIAEGEPDWLLWAARQRDSEPQGPACFGIDAGAWCRKIADRVPDGARVAVRTHADAAGARYARQIVTTLRGRCQVFRAKMEGEGVAK
jgi:hypothetical protein